MISGRYTTETLLTVITAAVVGITVLFNDVNIQIRINEIRMFLRRSSREDNSIDHMGLVMKYRLHRQMYENRISDSDTGIIETRINSILSGTAETEKVPPAVYTLMSVPVLFSINAIRYVIGMPVIGDIKEDEVNLSLEVAYYYERNKDYRKAIALYSRILDEPVSGRPLKAGVLLHQGFCYSIIGDYSRAREKYLAVIRDYGDISTAVTAAVMLRYLEGFRTEIEKVLNTDKDSPGKSEKLYKLIAYNESYEVLKKIENTGSAAEREKIKFFKGRTLEEMGEQGKALDIYQQIILDNPGSEYAAPANRRIFLVGSVNIEGEKIKKLAIENNRLINDEVLVKMSDEDSKYRAGTENENGDSAGVKDSLREKITGSGISSSAGPDSIDKMIKKSEEKLNENKKPDVRRTQVREIKVKIFTNDGNIFTGTIVSETADEIVINSSLGNVKISKSKISRRLKI